MGARRPLRVDRQFGGVTRVSVFVAASDSAPPPLSRTRHLATGYALSSDQALPQRLGQVRVEVLELLDAYRKTHEAVARSRPPRARSRSFRSNSSPRAAR